MAWDKFISDCVSHCNVLLERGDMLLQLVLVDRLGRGVHVWRLIFRLWLLRQTGTTGAVAVLA
eukprot:9442451-Pyramimonas_sp.AAC.1